MLDDLELFHVFRFVLSNTPIPWVPHAAIQRTTISRGKEEAAKAAPNAMVLHEEGREPIVLTPPAGAVMRRRAAPLGGGQIIESVHADGRTAVVTAIIDPDATPAQIADIQSMVGSSRATDSPE